MKLVNYLALTLIIVGGLNWGLVGAFQFNLVEALFGVATVPTTIVYFLVGIAAIYSVIFFRYVAITPNHVGVNRDE